MDPIEHFQLALRVVTIAVCICSNTLAPYTSTCRSVHVSPARHVAHTSAPACLDLFQKRCVAVGLYYPSHTGKAVYETQVISTYSLLSNWY